MLPRLVLLVLAISLALITGCQPAVAARSFKDPDELSRYAALPLLSASHSAELREEFARLISEHATPAALDPGRGVRDAGVARDLLELFPRETRIALGKQLAAHYPSPGLRAAPLMHRDAAELARSCEERRRAYQRIILKHPLVPTHEHRKGLAADTSYIDAVEIGNHLQAIHVGQLLQAGQLQQLREPMVVMANAVEWLSREKHVLPRIAAVRRRQEWLAAVHAIANHPQVDDGTCIWLLELITSQLERWPPDADTWIGERALGLHTYELVRDGYLLSIMPYEELRKLRATVGTKRLGEIIGKNVDSDQVFYLRTMRRAIAACELPFPQRQTLWQEIEADLESRRDSDDYPFIADQIVLVNMESSQRLQALDRARCDGWRLALATRCGVKTPAATIHPLTGESLSVRTTPEWIRVEGVDPADESSVIAIHRR